MLHEIDSPSPRISRSHATTESNRTGTWRFLRPVSRERTAPCAAACPAGEEISRVEMLAAQGRFHDAARSILLENPFPAVCGRVCFHPCEGACNRSFLDAPIAIRHLERFVGDAALTHGVAPPTAPSPENGRVAITGAGPAGLSAAYFLARLGYACDLFESLGEPGGLLRWGIPEYRLPKAVLRGEIARIEALGIRIHRNRPFTPGILKEHPYAAAFLAAGQGRPVRLNIPGEDLARDGRAFLEEIRDGRARTRAKRVAVIGGGNTAVDLSRSLVRMGTSPVLVYRRRREDMPAFGHEVRMALEEGVSLMDLYAPVRIERTDGRFGLIVQPMRARIVEPGRRARVVPEGDPRTLWVDEVFRAIGADAERGPLTPADDEAGRRAFSHCTLVEREVPTLFGGDVVNPVKSVADAIASGKQAAMVLDTYLRSGPSAVAERLEACRVGDGDALSMEIYTGGPRRDRSPKVIRFEEINVDFHRKAERGSPPILPPKHRTVDFTEVEGAFTAEAAEREAGRCFHCGICDGCGTCALFCPEMAVIDGPPRRINLDYCKGCGICVTECPCGAMALVEETP